MRIKAHPTYEYQKRFSLRSQIPKKIATIGASNIENERKVAPAKIRIS